MFLKPIFGWDSETSSESILGLCVQNAILYAYMALFGAFLWLMDTHANKNLMHGWDQSVNAMVALEVRTCSKSPAQSAYVL